MVLSIIIPIYNNEKHVHECINSILRQKVEEYEIILVDDGSTDLTSKICDNYAEQYSNIVVIHQQNGGPTSARKAGCNCAKGEYIYCVDSDDYLIDGCLEKIFQFIDNYHSDMIVMGYKDNRGDHFCMANQGLYTGSDLLILSDAYFYDEKTVGINGGSLLYSLWVKVIKKSLFVEFQNIIPREVVIGEDALLTGYILKKSNSVYVVNYAGYYYRVENVMSAMNTFNSNRMKQINELLIQMKILCKDNQNKVAAYIYMVYDKQLSLLADNSENYEYFVGVIKSSYKFDDLKNLLENLKISNATIKQKIKMICIRKHFYRCLWIIKKYMKA